MKMVSWSIEREARINLRAHVVVGGFDLTGEGFGFDEDGFDVEVLTLFKARASEGKRGV